MERTLIHEIMSLDSSDLMLNICKIFINNVKVKKKKEKNNSKFLNWEKGETVFMRFR